MMTLSQSRLDLTGAYRDDVRFLSPITTIPFIPDEIVMPISAPRLVRGLSMFAYEVA